MSTSRSPRLRIPTIPYPAFRTLLGVVMRSDVTMIGVENIPDGPCIACSNHPNREEILLGYRTFRRPVRIMVQHGLLDADFLADEFRLALTEQYHFPKWMARLGPVAADYIARQNQRLGCIPVVREKDSAQNRTAINRQAYRDAIAALRRGEVIGMAPEGMLSPDGVVGELQRGAAWMAWHFARRKQPMPVLPIIFHGVSELDRFVLSRNRLVVALGRPIHMEIKPGEGRRDAVGRFTAELGSTLKNLQDRVLELDGLPPLRRSRKHGQAGLLSSPSSRAAPSGRITSSTPDSNRA
jgi:1-acyl-sn-glycerol-3-phosphate acyltransferase